MMALALFPEREIFLQAGHFTIRWYGLLYLLAFLLAWWWLPKLSKYRGLKLSADGWLSVVTWGMGGVLVGGRLGYVLLYDVRYFMERPIEIFYLWQGGMASHGGFIGVGIAMWIVSKRLNISLLSLLDVLAVPAALGLAAGRLGNVINQEIFINETWGMLAVIKDLAVGGITYWYLQRAGAAKMGKVLGVFLITYSLLRFGIEYGREQPLGLWWGLYVGQWYTVPLLVIGGWLVYRAGASNEKTYGE